ncbi:MAG: hypothetical protein IPM63_04505 [Acidobacteriota bacterium]|nr:MAG: hypothetical protein IPM63_04505 [Acidobacteriota bacterium]
MGFLCKVSAQEVLTNAAVIEMVRAELPEEIIIAKIEAGSGAFDTSTEALKELTEAGVPKAVIVAMIAEAGRMSKAAAADAKEEAKLLGAVPEQGKLKDLLSLSKIYILTDDLKARDRIEKELRKIKRFEVVDKVEICDFVIKYETWTELVNVTATVIGNTATARENRQLVGLFTVMTASDVSDEGRLRMVYSVRKTKYYIWEDNPAESTTKQFVKDLQKAAALSGVRH